MSLRFNPRGNGLGPGFFPLRLRVFATIRADCQYEKSAVFAISDFRYFLSQETFARRSPSIRATRLVPGTLRILL